MSTIQVRCTNRHEVVEIETFERKPRNMAGTEFAWYGLMMSGADQHRAWEEAGRPCPYADWHLHPDFKTNPHRRNVLLDEADEIAAGPGAVPSPDRQAWADRRDVHHLNPAPAVRQRWSYTCPECKIQWHVTAEKLQAICARIANAGVNDPLELLFLRENAR